MPMPPALVLAAGLGTRIRAVAGDLPKPLIPFGGQPILAHNLRWLAAGGVRDVWINLHYNARRITELVGDGAGFGLRIRTLFEPELLGTAGALANLATQAPEAVPGAVLVVYGDNLLRFDLAALLAAHRRRDAAATIALFDRDSHVHTGIAGGRVETGADGRVLAFREGGAPIAGRDLVNAGVYVVEPAVRRLIVPRNGGPAVDFGRDVFPAMLREGLPLFGHVIEDEGFCLGLDTPESHAAGTALLDAGRIVLA
ncbi:MAG: nucleotidyltransferase family protein [Acidisphaera sp.]|nr:nucleotidyltransferase family protein [Acidisphaera sp.]